jgi:hypothetical protein
MPYVLYVRLQDENTIVAFTMEATTGQVTPHAAILVAGGRPCWRSAQNGTYCMSDIAGSQRLRASRLTPPLVGSRPRGRSQRPMHPRFWPPTAQVNIRLLSRRVCGSLSSRRGRRGRRPTLRHAGHGHRRPCYPGGQQPAAVLVTQVGDEAGDVPLVRRGAGVCVQAATGSSYGDCRQVGGKARFHKQTVTGRKRDIIHAGSI